MTESGSTFETWSDRISEADQAAEGAFRVLTLQYDDREDFRDAVLFAIAAELRAARIAARPAVSPS